MARPSTHLTAHLPDVRCSTEQKQRLMQDAGQAGFAVLAEYIRHRLFSGEALRVGKGMSQTDLHQTLDDLTFIIQEIDRGQLVNAKAVAEVVARRVMAAIRDETLNPPCP